MNSNTVLGHYNRYELLFMDDNDIINPSSDLIVKKKKQIKNANVLTSTVSNSANTTSTIPINNINNKSPKKHEVDGSKKKNSKTNLQHQVEKENKQPSNNNNNNKYDVVGQKKSLVSSTNEFSKNSSSNNYSPLLTDVNYRKQKTNNSDNRSSQQYQRNVKPQQQNINSNITNIRRFNPRENEPNNIDHQSVHNTIGVEYNQFQTNRQYNKAGERSTYKNRKNIERDNRKREFDRHSGSDRTGIKNVDKRDGIGSQNWGGQHTSNKDNNELTYRKNKIFSTTAIYNNSDKVENNLNNKTPDSSDNTMTKNEEIIPDETLTNADNKENTINNEKPITETEVKEWTLDEWKAQQQQRAKPQFNIRKAGEGEDNSQWKKMIVLNKKNKKDQDPDEELLEYDPSMYPQRVGRQQRILDIQFRFNDGRRTAGAIVGYKRGGLRGDVRGVLSTPSHNDNKLNNNDTANYNRNRRQFNTGKARPNQSHQENIAPKVNDERQFPTLT